MIPYRTRRLVRNLLIAILVLVLVASAALICWLLWLNRYIVYTRDGAKLDFSLSLQFPEGELAQPPEPGETIEIYYNEGDNLSTPESSELKPLSGIYITAEMLTQDLDAVQKAARSIPADTAVMIDVKNIRGEFYYTTTNGRNSDKVDPGRMDILISTLKQTNHYLIARVPALRDYWFGLENVDNGIFNPNRLSLWIDAERCYWLNPKAEGTVSYLIAIITELKSKGFDEVVFTDYCLPPTDNIYFPDDKVAAINDSAADLVKICSTDTFAVSFANSSDTFTLPDGRSRLYLENIAAADAASKAQQTGLEDPDIRLVFLTDLMDTRFDDYSVLRPMQLN